MPLILTYNNTVRSLLILLLSFACYANPHDTAQQIYVEVFSPYCPGRSLRDCPSASADKLKENILLKLQSGKSKDDVMSELEKEFGEKVLSSPKSLNNKLLLWLFPLIFFITGIGIIIMISRKKNAE